ERGAEIDGSVRLDTRELHHLAPLLDFIGDELAKIGGRARKHRAAQVGKPCLKLGIGEGGVDLVVELVDDLGRASSHSITSSARASTVGGISRPSALAVLGL